jgi:hypothetical protein
MNIVLEYEKIIRVIDSCKNLGQCETAAKMLSLWKERNGKRNIIVSYSRAELKLQWKKKYLNQ